ncbi:MAG: transporter substrate-binding domain-containing protein [Actinobacteria bacterium]|nr:transporter substrate-binding domain-containing protein [Actinomycetota bacterium]
MTGSSSRNTVAGAVPTRRTGRLANRNLRFAPQRRCWGLQPLESEHNGLWALPLRSVHVASGRAHAQNRSGVFHPRSFSRCLRRGVARPTASGAQGNGGSAPAEATCDPENPPLFAEGVLTVATDRPAYPPWFEGSPKNYSGYEGEVANEIAERMGLDITWVVEPFNKSYAPGAKSYDFDINQISITPERQEAVDFSDGYFQNNQGLLAPEGGGPLPRRRPSRS